MNTEIRNQDIQRVRELFHEHFHGHGLDTHRGIKKIGERYGYKGKILAARTTHPTSTNQNLEQLIKHIQES